jgi:NADPH-dependent 2,4-dienoyl-CoA reductase/sulfur reductase-like enzyme
MYDLTLEMKEMKYIFYNIGGISTRNGLICLLQKYVIEGIVNDFEELVERPPDIFKTKYGIDIIINTRGYKIDRFRKQVHTTDGGGI